MVSKYSKTKGYRASDIEQARIEREKVLRIKEEQEAYEELLSNCQYQPVPGHYRSGNGHHMQIVGNGSTWSRQEVSAEEQLLPFGHAWVPSPPIAQPGLPMTVLQLFKDEINLYTLAKPLKIGFNDLGDAVDANGLLYRVHQLNLVLVINTGPFELDYEIVTAPFDSSREHIRVYEHGHIVCVPPNPQNNPSFIPAEQIVLEPLPSEPFLDLGLVEPKLQPAPVQQMPELQTFMDSSFSSADSGLEASGNAAPNGFDDFDPNFFDMADLADGANYQTNDQPNYQPNCQPNGFGIDPSEIFNIDDL